MNVSSDILNAIILEINFFEKGEEKRICKLGRKIYLRISLILG